MFSGIIGERIDAAVISITEIIKQVPVINQMSMTNPGTGLDNPLFYGILPGDEGDAQVRETQMASMAKKILSFAREFPCC